MININKLLWYYFDFKMKWILKGWGCSIIFGIIFFGSRFGKDFLLGLIIVVNCINVDINRNMWDFVKIFLR